MDTYYLAQIQTITTEASAQDRISGYKPQTSCDLHCMDAQRAFLPIALGPLPECMAFCPQQCKRLLYASASSSFSSSYTTATVSRTSLRSAAILVVLETNDLFTGPVITLLPCQRITLLTRELEEAWV